MAKKWLLVVLAGAASGCLLMAGGTVLAQKTKGKERPALTKYLMRAINQPNCAGLAASFKDSGPADDEAWDVAACQASCLNEMSYLLMDDGRCPDAVWAGAAKELRGGSAAVLDAVEKNDLDGARAAFKQVTAACAACHKAHKT